MKLIDAIDAGPRQTMNLLTEKGERVKFDLFYLPSQQGWFFNLAYGAKIINGLRLTASPNVLRNFRNLLPFGLACVTDGPDPQYLDDFAAARARLYILTVADVAAIETAITT